MFKKPKKVMSALIVLYIQPYVRRLMVGILSSSVLMLKYVGSCVDPLDDESTAVGVDQFAKHVANLHADTDLAFSQEYEVGIYIRCIFWWSI